jgi:dual specificity phosphatase 3
MNESTTPPDPLDWHRRLCVVNPWLIVSGDLDTSNPAVGLLQLQEWIDAGITDIVDLRGEWHDTDFVAEFAPEINYHWLGTHDSGGSQSDDWYESGLAIARQVQEDGGRLIVHCHMGVNRAPSMAFRLLLDAGVEPVAALASLREARPIVGILYADSALDHHHRELEIDDRVRGAEMIAVDDWFDANPVELGWIISRIRRGEEIAHDEFTS